MVKNIIIAVVLLLTSVTSNVSGQGNPIEAKAAYLLAEECYGKGDYKCALDFLQQVRTNLGTTNCKILYLQIMATRELYTKNPNVADRVLPLVTEFEKSADYADFNEEKVLEVSKLKLLLKAEQKAYVAETEIKNRLEKSFAEEFNRFGPYGINMALLITKSPELKLKDWKDYKNSRVFYPREIEYNAGIPGESYPFCAMDKDFDFKNKLSSITLYTDNTVNGYRSILVYADKKVNKESAVSGSALKEATAIMEEYRKRLGVEPVVNEYDLNDNAQGHVTSYKWVRNKRVIELHRLYYPNGKLPVVKLVETLYFTL